MHKRTQENQHIKVKKSKIENNGIFAKRNIAKGTQIIEYVGKKIKKSVSDNLSDEEQEKARIYLFDLNDKYDLDGDISWNPARFINHSCAPNSHSENIDEHIWITALRDIKKGEEITYDYGFCRKGWEKYICKCGKSNCFGFIVAKKHRNAIAKTKRYKKLIAN